MSNVLKLYYNNAIADLLLGWLVQDGLGSGLLYRKFEINSRSEYVNTR